MVSVGAGSSAGGGSVAGAGAGAGVVGSSSAGVVVVSVGSCAAGCSRSLGLQVDRLGDAVADGAVALAALGVFHATALPTAAHRTRNRTAPHELATNGRGKRPAGARGATPGARQR